MRRPLAAAIFMLAGMALLFAAAHQPPLAQHAQVKVGDVSVLAEVAPTDAQQQKGLGGRSGLPARGGMLFVFPYEANWAMWMKDMNFGIDIVWLDSTGKVVDVARHVAPGTWSGSFKPKAKAHYVLEVPAGAAQHLKPGMKAEILLP